MRVLIDSYDTCCQNKAGGVQVRIKKIYELLKKRDINVNFFDKFSVDIKESDIIHIFKLEYQKYPLIECAKKNKKKVVISTIMSTKTGWKRYLYRLIGKLPFLSIYKINYKMLKAADILICETIDEKEYIEKYYKINSDKIKVIPNGIDYDFYNGKEIYEKIGDNKKYILQVGRFDPNKNQLNLIRALKDTGINLVFIGGEDYNCPEYYKKCIREADKSENIYFLGWVEKESNLLKSAFCNADTVVLPSFYETFGMAALEGAIVGAKVALSNTLSILSYSSFENCNTFTPSDVNGMKEAVMKTFNEEKDDRLKEKIMKEFSWSDVIDKHIEIYEGLMNESIKKVKKT